MTPGSNLLSQALRLIRPQTVQYYQYTGRTLNQARQYVATYAAAVPLSASVQSVDRNTYNQLGLDLQKNYIMIYVSQNVIDLSRDAGGDQFVINGDRYQLESENTWNFSDGWASCLAVQVKNGA